MAWTYSGDPSSSPKDEVRFLISDTDSSDPFLQDEEILYTLGLVYPNGAPASGNYLPAAYCCDSLYAKFARKADSKSVGDLRIAFANQAKRFGDLATLLRNRATLAAVPIYVGGQSLMEKAGDDTDPDRVQPAAKIDGMDLLAPMNRALTDGSVAP